MWRPLALTLLLLVPVCGSDAGYHHKDAPGGTWTARNFPQTRLEDRQFWYEEAEAELLASLSRQQNNNVARNVVLFLGDGLSVTTITAARIYRGQQRGESGEEASLAWEHFPDAATIKTYTVDKQVPDSAATATAYLCGAKTNYYTVGVDATAQYKNCSTVTDLNKLTSVAAWALAAGKRAGFVTNTRVTHATPAALYGHSATRDWECDAALAQEDRDACPDFKDIALQLLEDWPGRDFNVMMGGGYQCLSADAVSTPEDPVDEEWACLRGDGRDLFLEWQAMQAAEGRNYSAVRTRSELMAQNWTTVDRLMGIFANTHMPYEYVKREQALDVPTLAEMTGAALDVLQGHEQGFFLLVEGGMIDQAHHFGLANAALDETAALDDAVRLALNRLDLQDTLVIVTADHGHVATMSGYPQRGQDITGLSMLADDGLPMTTLSYTNGPGYDTSYVVSPDGSEAVRRDISADDVTAYGYIKPAGAPRGSETHGGEDVSLFAAGPMSHLFQNVHEQSYIAHVIGYASCTGPNQQHCDIGSTDLP